MAQTEFPKLRLPKIQRVELRKFSLFAANPNAEFSARNGVLCLVGANGIGKSTLLSAINFCLTGTVPDPNRTFESMDEYYRFTRQYSGAYFRGRISGGDEEDAEVTLTFSLGTLQFTVTRGLFEPEELRGLTISGDASVGSPTHTGESRSERHARYAEALVHHSGVASFQEFVFLQHFLFTFDEQRRTLFWNPRTMERVLYRAFGADPQMAQRADSLKREIQQQDSRVRNSQWEATRLSKRINKLRAHTQQQTDAQQKFDILSDNHRGLTERFAEESSALKDAEAAVRDATLRVSELSVRETALRDDYARAFDRRLSPDAPLTHHPLIAHSISTGACELCGSSGVSAMALLATRASSSQCPLCDSVIAIAAPDPESVSHLRGLDQELTAIKKSLRDVHAGLASLRAVERAARERWTQSKDQLDAFDEANSALLNSLRLGLNSNASDAALATFKEQLATIEREKATAYQLREEFKGQLSILTRQLEEHYAAVEQRFVPALRQLAEQFLGMPLSVQLHTGASGEVGLLLEVRGTARRHSQQLSESQRFFLDIALRMALTQHMSDPQSPGAMYIDTPEGSLDIAYEKRAGTMLAMFAEAGHQVIMTANLNSSRLLLELAARCGRANMTLCRMTDWAELSTVQQDEEELFDKAFADIEDALGA